MEEDVEASLVEVIERMEQGARVTRAWLMDQYPRTWRDLFEALQVESVLHPPPFAAAGAYRLTHLLGRGSYGSVYYADCDSKQDGETRMSPVAVKILHPMLLEDPNAEARFLREARIGREIRHPHLVPVEDAGTVDVHGSRHLYLVMEYLSGGALRDRMEAAGPMPVSTATTYAAQIASGLEALDRAGVIHRDLKPENVLLDGEGRARITDLGVAKLVDDALKISSSGRFRGSVLYTSPEQIKGLPVVPGSDLYALGWILYEMLSGFHPFDGLPIGESLKAQATVLPPAIRSVRGEVSPELEDLLDRLLAKSSDARPGSAEEVLRILGGGDAC